MPRTIEEIEAYDVLERLNLVKTLTREVRLSNDDRVKEAFIETDLLQSGRDVLRKIIS